MTEQCGDHEDWSAGTFAGLPVPQRRAVAGASPAQRLAWLEEALRLAEASGALLRARRARRRACEALWSNAPEDPPRAG